MNRKDRCVRGAHSWHGYQGDSRTERLIEFKQYAIHGRSFALAFGEIILKRTIVELLLAGTFQPGNIFSILNALKKFFVVLDWNNDGNGFAFARHDLEFWH